MPLTQSHELSGLPAAMEEQGGVLLAYCSIEIDQGGCGDSFGHMLYTMFSIFLSHDFIWRNNIKPGREGDRHLAQRPAKMKTKQMKASVGVLQIPQTFKKKKNGMEERDNITFP